jgi:hypothetical protein
MLINQSAGQEGRELVDGVAFWHGVNRDRADKKDAPRSGASELRRTHRCVSFESEGVEGFPPRRIGRCGLVCCHVAAIRSKPRPVRHA